MAVGVRLGLNEMGLLREVQAEPDAEGWSVRVRLRLTSPGCQYYFLFKDTLEERLAAHPQISRVVVDWDSALDWTPTDLSPEARDKLEEHRRALQRSQT
jgi:metal-sulfur cluster biosynthetic enzyme